MGYPERTSTTTSLLWMTWGNGTSTKDPCRRRNLADARIRWIGGGSAPTQHVGELLGLGHGGNFSVGDEERENYEIHANHIPVDR